ncbi:MAG: amidohydrolase/deacetylase family metallohydrolase [Alphaproteobacteria bacterium]|mgnify:CR=1 FL=1|nr:amidohydrolase/deacetylase family metallohydrolase [Alphaproteobacteria bacterium]
MAYDLILRGARVLDPSQNIDRVADVAFAGGRVAAVGEGLAAGGAQVEDVRGLIVTPGLIDLHTHVYWGGTSLGIDADDFGRRSGVTTCVDTGSAGPGNFPGFRKHVIERSDVRILAYLHISFAGIFAFGRRIMLGESLDSRLIAVRDTVEVIEANRDVIVGVKVRIGRHTSGENGIAPLESALQAAEQVGLPVMVHIDEPPPSYEELCDRLRPGDVLTHCFRPFPNAPMRPDGRVRPAVLRARERGVLFDIGHGKGSFAFATARPMLAAGFRPDTISSDIHILCIDGPAYDQVTTMSKFLCLGMDLPAVVAASTVNAARALNRPDLGTLRPGAAGDATLLSVREGHFDYEDVVGERMRGSRRILAEGAVIGGRLWHRAPHGDQQHSQRAAERETA